MIALGLGFVVGRWSGSTESASVVVSQDHEIASSVETAESPKFLHDFLAEVRGAVARGSWHNNREWTQLLDALTPGETQDALELLKELPLNPANLSLTKALYFHWAEKAPIQAVEHARARKVRGGRESAIEAAFEGWAFADPEGLGDWANNQPDDFLKRKAFSAVAPHLASADPAAAFALALANPSFYDLNRELIKQTFSAWGLTEPQVALAALNRHLVNQNRTAARIELFRAWATVDPAEAARVALAHERVSERRAALGGTFSQWPADDPAGVIEFLKTHDLGAAEVGIHGQVARVIAMSDPDLVLEFAASLPAGPVRMEVLDGAFGSLAESDPARAARLFSAALESEEDLLRRSQYIAEEYAKVDPVAAMQWVLSLPADYSRSNALTRIAEAAAISDPHEVVSIAARMPDGSERNSFLADVFLQFARSSPQSAWELFQSYPSGSLPPNTIDAMIQGAAQFDPELALVMVESVTDPRARTRAVGALMPGLSRSDPRRAADWLIQQTWMGDEQIYQGAYHLLSEWALWEPNSSTAWVRSLPDPNMKQRLLPDLIGELNRESPARAAALLPEITNPEERMRQTRAIATRWMSVDSSAARLWIQASELPPEEQQELFEMFGG